MLKTAKKIFGKIWKSLEIPWKNVSLDSMKSKAWPNLSARLCSIFERLFASVPNIGFTIYGGFT